MTPPVITFFNNKGGMGRTSLVYNVAWMLADLGHRVLAADLDPQANLTSAFLDETEIERLWESSGARRTAWGAIRPFQENEGQVRRPILTETGEDRLALLAGDLALSPFEEDLSNQWSECLNGKPRAFRIMSAFWTVLTMAANQHSADIVLVDTGPSLDAINRAAMVASDHVVIPVAPDPFSLQGLRNLGPTLTRWRLGWAKRLDQRPDNLPDLPSGLMNVIGYIVLGQVLRLYRPVPAYPRWMAQIPGEFRNSVLAQPTTAPPPVENDPYCLTQLKPYHSLLPLAQEARKPMFALKPADGAFGGHLHAAQRAYFDFRDLATSILDHIAQAAA